MKKENLALRMVAMLSTVTIYSLSLPANAAGPAAAPQPDSRPPLDVMVLEQKAMQTGPMNMVIGKQAVKFTLDKLGICWLASAPKWQSYCYNPEYKTILVRDHAAWKSGFFELPGQKKPKKTLLLKLKETGVHEKVAGYKCRKADLICTPTAPYKRGEPHTPYKTGCVWIAEKFPAPHELSEVMKNLVKVDVSNGMVLKFSALKPNSFTEQEVAYETLKIVEAKKPASFFDPPTNYKPVKSEMQLLMGESEEPDMDFLKKK